MPVTGNLLVLLASGLLLASRRARLLALGDAATPQYATLVESLPWADRVVLADDFMPAGRSTGRCAGRGRALLGAVHARPPAYTLMVWSD